jgi:hypothetical protein
MIMPEKAKRIFNRSVFEFGPPLLFALVWIWCTSNPFPELWKPYLKELSLTFVASSWIWAQGLRIHHQQTQAGKLEDIGQDVTTVKTTLAAMDQTIKGMTPDVSPATIKLAVQLLRTLVQRANNQLEIVTTRLNLPQPAQKALPPAPKPPAADPEKPESPPATPGP